MTDYLVSEKKLQFATYKNLPEDHSAAFYSPNTTDAYINSNADETISNKTLDSYTISGGVIGDVAVATSAAISTTNQITLITAANIIAFGDQYTIGTPSNNGFKKIVIARGEATITPDDPIFSNNIDYSSVTLAEDTSITLFYTSGRWYILSNAGGVLNL